MKKSLRGLSRKTADNTTINNTNEWKFKSRKDSRMYLSPDLCIYKCFVGGKEQPRSLTSYKTFSHDRGFVNMQVKLQVL
jgi:hypothetical protein